MYEELVKRLREIHPEEFGDAWDFAFACQRTMREAAYAIEELQKKYLASERDATNLTGWLAEEHAKHLWIPVTERLPLYGQDALVVRTYGDGEKCQEVLMAHIAVWNEETGEKWWNATNITHWMPIPQPPKEEK